MNDEQTDKTDTQGKDTPKDIPNDDKPLNPVDEAKKILAETKAENDRREKLQKEDQRLAAEKVLSGTSGGHVETTAKKEETPKEYNDRIDKEISEGKHNE